MPFEILAVRFGRGDAERVVFVRILGLLADRGEHPQEAEVLQHGRDLGTEERPFVVGSYGEDAQTPEAPEGAVPFDRDTVPAGEDPEQVRAGRVRGPKVADAAGHPDPAALKKPPHRDEVRPAREG